METPKYVESDVIDVDDIEEAEKESCLVGRLVTQKQYWNPPNLIQVIKKVWKPKHGVSSMAWEESKLILFRFDDVLDRDWVLENQPWSFKGSLFTIKKFTGGNEQQLSSLDNVTVEHASFWVRLYDVPFSCMNEKTLCRFAKRIGSLESVDVSGEDLIGKFIRFKISINITKPLLRGITIRVKGDHLWIPLKYEWLPIYCFSCGTIGHDHNDCQSYNRNLEYSALEFKENEEKKDTSPALPHDIVENILSRLPAKYLIRYKSVCKQWEATISDPKFAETHLQQHKNSSSRNLVAWEQLLDFYQGLYVVEIQDDQFQFVSGIEHSRKYSSLGDKFLCECDGLYLKIFYTTPDYKGKTYLLWNPSCRAYKEIWCPQSIDNSETKRKDHVIYYNPLMKDYKIVMTDWEHYAVFSCRYNKWSEVKEMKDVPCNNEEIWWYHGVSFNGSVYWLFVNYFTISESVIICFDGEVEKFKKLPVPDYRDQVPDYRDQEVGSLILTSPGGHLLFFAYERYPTKISIWKKSENDSWVEYRVLKLLSPRKMTFPLCWLNEWEVIVEVEVDHFKYNYFLHDQRENTFEVVRKSHNRYYGQPVVYRENLFLQ